MNIVVADLETYWSTTHSLSKMPAIAYVMHPDTEVISCSIKINNQPTEVYFGHEVGTALRAIDWGNTFFIGHNMSGFDSMIFAWRYGINPKIWGCTAQMARLLGYAKTTGVSLKALSEHLGIGIKDNTALVNTKGKHLKDFTEEELQAMEVYNRDDTEMCFKLFKEFAPVISKRELKLMDMTTRMLTEPRFVVDQALLRSTLREEQERKHLMLLDVATMIGAYAPGQTDDETAEAARKVLASAGKFSEILRACNVPVPMKPSPTNPDKETPALAKTDQAFIQLQNHPDPMVAAAAQARLGVKSTLLETRIEAFISAAESCDGRLPVPLRYYGADTTGRWSGEQYNPQNLPRIGKKPKPSDALRMALKAPKGSKVVVADQSGIELRVNHFLWKVPSSMELFRADPEKADLYVDFAGNLYEIEGSEVSSEQRQVGKVAHLGLGFGSGAATFKKVAKLMGGVDLTDEESKDVVKLWRSTYSEIPAGWKTCHAALGSIYSFGGTPEQIDPWGLCWAVEGGIKTPQGFIHYPKLRLETENGNQEWVYGEGRNRTRIYAGKVTENIVQHLAREIIADNALDVKRSTGYYPTLMVHDELVYIVPEQEAEDVLAEVHKAMRTAPKWWPELVTWSAGGIADAYGEAK